MYDVLVLGAGPGGYEAAIHCAQHGLKTALVEEREVGGTCLNRGCIPTKALLHGAEVFESIREAETLGISVTGAAMDFARLASFRDRQVATLRRGVEALEKANGVTVIRGRGVLLDAHTVQVKDEKIETKNLILATGAKPAVPPIPGIENAENSDTVLHWTSLPQSVILIGGGVIGIEFATLFSALGVRVAVLEMMPDILPGVDPIITGMLKEVLEKKQVNICCNARVQSIESGSVSYVSGEKTLKMEAEKVICCIGRSPMTAGIGLEEAGIALKKGFVVVDDYLRTSVPGVYAIGDITGKMQLAHAAGAQAHAVANTIAGSPATVNYRQVPACVYTHPEIAYIGLTEKAAREAGYEPATGSFRVATNGRSMVMNERTGICILVSDRRTGELLGAQIMAPNATEMIAEIAAVMRCEGTIEELGMTVHPHPTVSEIIMEAALDTRGESCHNMPRRMP